MTLPDQWYFADGWDTRGPVSFIELKQRAAGYKLTKTTLVWAPGMTQWVPASEVPSLLPVTPPPLPQTVSLPPVLATSANSHTSPPHQPYTEPNKRSFSFFEKPTTEEEALKAVKDGSNAGYLLAGAYILTAFLTGSSGRSVTTGGALPSSEQGDTIFIMIVLAVIAIGLALWIRHKASLVGLVILCIWFSIEVLAKLAAFATYPNARFPAIWFAVYLGIFGGIVTAMRGATFIRRMKRALQAKLGHS